MAQEYISVRELAKELGVHHNSVRRYVARLGIVPEKRRYKGSRAVQDVLTVQDADYVRTRRREEGFDAKALGQSVDATGWFYVIKVVPELDASRLKLGYADDVDSRLAQHRTAAPTAELVERWPCRRSWEAAAMDCITQTGCRLILNEVYECDDVPSLLEGGETFFRMMPKPGARPSVSDRSPRRS